jgi:2-amino-4-hydroxy-6-hydroxymethyldihydropteridine diphosphokinase
MAEPDVDNKPVLRRWLLVLGSNVDGAGAILDAALLSLSTLGTLLRHSPRTLGDDIARHGPAYLNQLAELQSAMPQAALTAALKAVEREQGRAPQRLADGLCDLDIDLLAWHDGDALHWVSDKPLQIPAVRTQLAGWNLS